MLNFIDKQINGITMYRLILGGLAALAGVSMFYSIFGIVHFSFFSQLISLVVLVATCELFNRLFAKILGAQTGVESTYITAFILFFLMTPSLTKAGLLTLVGTGVLAVGSKYLIAPYKRHIFNPAAVGVFLAMVIFGEGAIWWIATPMLLPFVLLLVLLVVRKIRRTGLFLTATLVGTLTATLVQFMDGGSTSLLVLLWSVLASWPIVFLSGIMLTEPATTPPTHKWQYVYGALVGFLFGLPVHVGIIYMTPEVALLIGNLFSYAVSPKVRLMLTLKKRQTVARDTYHFAFAADRAMAFSAGQYLEWTLQHPHPDNRGNRRYFTIAASPTEQELAIGFKANDKSSTFKKALLAMKEGDQLLASQLSGDFVLDPKTCSKAVFIAGGIGITPFRSMVKELIDRHEQCAAVLFYACMTEADIAYRELFDSAATIGIKTVYVLGDKEHPPVGWQGEVGFLNAEIIARQVPDWQSRVYYISGPNAMVQNYRKLLIGMGVASTAIKTDYFPGL